MAGSVTLPWLTLYSASKYALCASLTDGLRMELKKDGIHTVTVVPGYVKTSFHDHVLGGEPPPRSRGKKFAITPKQCAEFIVRGVERDARTVMAPWSGWLLVVAERLFPSLVDAQLARILHDV